MVVLKPTLEGERIKVCRCGHVGLCSPVRERTSFFPSRYRSPTNYRAECRWCSARKQRARRARVGRLPLTSEQRAAASAAQARYRARHPERTRQQRRVGRARRKARDPEGLRAAELARKRRYRQRVKADRQRHQAALETERLDRRLRAERQGLVLVTPVRQNPGGALLPTGPTAVWLRAYLRATGQSHIEAAARLDIHARRLRAILHGEYRSVRHGTVDQMLTAARVVVSVNGRAVIAVEDLYPGSADKGES